MNISEVLPNGNVRVVIPISFRNIKQPEVIGMPELECRIQAQTPLLIAIANAFVWQAMLEEKQVANIDALAKLLGKLRSVVSHALQLTLLSPKIIHMALAGTLPAHITTNTFKAGIPANWDEQERFLGI